MYEINNTVKLLVEEVKSLKNEIERTNRKAKRLEIENERLKKSVNLSLLKIDALEQGWGTCGLKATCGLLSHEVRPSVAYGSSLKLKLRIIHLTPKSSKYQFCKR